MARKQQGSAKQGSRQGSPRSESKEKSAGTVRVSYSPHDDDLPVVGKTVKQVLAEFGEAWNIGKDTRCFVNGERARLTMRLKNGDRLEFARRAAEKGRS